MVSNIYSWETVEKNFLLPRSLAERVAVNREFANNPEHASLVMNLGHLDFAFKIFKRNFEAFRSFSLMVQEQEHVNSLETIDEQYFDKRFAYATESSGLLLNFLGSMNMLVDVTRRLIRCEIENQDFGIKFSKQVAKLFGETGLSDFLKDLRNYTLHRAVLPTMPIRTPSKFEMCLDVTDLKKWGKIKNSTLSFIKANEVKFLGNELVPIESPIVRYYSLQSKLNAWLFNSILYLNSEVVEANNKFIEKIRTV